MIEKDICDFNLKLIRFKETKIIEPYKINSKNKTIHQSYRMRFFKKIKPIIHHENQNQHL